MPITRTCETCGAQFSIAPSKAQRGEGRYCSYACRPDRRTGAALTCTCIVCRQQFSVLRSEFRKAEQRGYRVGRYCSTNCRAQHRRIDSVVRRAHEEIAKQLDELGRIKTCRQCSGRFIPDHPRQRVCSDECRRIEARRYNRELNEVSHEQLRLACRECSRVFVAGYGNKRRTYCSVECYRRRASRVAKARRRARIRGARGSTPLDPFGVFERANWHCELCGTPTPHELRGTHEPNAPELDHIIPLARGGDHSINNVQCLCRHCNNVKGAQVMYGRRVDRTEGIGGKESPGPSALQDPRPSHVRTAAAKEFRDATR